MEETHSSFKPLTVKLQEEAEALAQATPSPPLLHLAFPDTQKHTHTPQTPCTRQFQGSEATCSEAKNKTKTQPHNPHPCPGACRPPPNTHPFAYRATSPFPSFSPPPPGRSAPPMLQEGPHSHSLASWGGGGKNIYPPPFISHILSRCAFRAPLPHPGGGGGVGWRPVCSAALPPPVGRAPAALLSPSPLAPPCTRGALPQSPSPHLFFLPSVPHSPTFSLTLLVEQTVSLLDYRAQRIRSRLTQPPANRRPPCCAAREPLPEAVGIRIGATS